MTLTDVQFHELMQVIKYIAGGCGLLIFIWIAARYS